MSIEVLGSIPRGGSVKKVILIADIHLDNNEERHEEQKYVMKELNESLKRDVDDKTVIMIGGDIYHNKGKKDTMCEMIWHTFLGRINEMCPVLVIPGNHDLNPKHDKRYPDSVEASLSGGCYKNIHYLGRTGIYRMGNMEVSTVSIKEIFQNKAGSGGVTELPEVPNWYSEEAEYKVMMLHSTVYEGTKESYNPERSKVPLGWIPKEVGYLMMGDLHIPLTHGGVITRQNMEIKFRKNGLTWGYPGSLSQNTVGETVGMHGYQIWDFEREMIIQVPIKQHTIRMTGKKEGDEWKLNNMTPEAIKREIGIEPVRVLLTMVGSPTYEEVKEIKERLGWNVKEVSRLKEIEREALRILPNTRGGISEEDVMNFGETIVEYLQSLEGNEEAYEELVKNPSKILESLHEMRGEDQVNEVIKKRKKAIMEKYERMMMSRSKGYRRGTMRILRVRCHKILSFNDMYMSFEEFVGKVVALIGKNGDGKTAIIETIIYGIFGRVFDSRMGKTGGKGNDIRSLISNKTANDDKPFIEVDIEIDEEEYRISRMWVKKAESETWESGKREQYSVKKVRTGEYEAIGASKVDEWVRSNIGGVEVIMEIVQSQGNDLDMFSMSLSEQTEILSKILRLEGYEELCEVLDEERRGIEAIEKTMQTSKGVTVENLKQYDEKDHSESREKMEKLREEIEKLESEKNGMVQDWHGVDMNETEEEDGEIEKKLKTMKRPEDNKEELIERKGEVKGWKETEETEEEIRYQLEEVKRNRERATKESEESDKAVKEKTKEYGELGVEPSLLVGDLENEGATGIYEEACERKETRRTRDELIREISKKETEKQRNEERIEPLEGLDKTNPLDELEPEEPSKSYKWDGERRLSNKTKEEKEKMEEEVERMKEKLSEEEEELMRMEVRAKPVVRSDIEVKYKRWKEINKYVLKRKSSYEKQKEMMEKKRTMEVEKAMCEKELENIMTALKDCPYNEKCEACRKQPLRIQKERLEEKVKKLVKEITKIGSKENAWESIKEWKEEYDSLEGVEEEVRESERYESWQKTYTTKREGISRKRREVSEKEKEIREVIQEIERDRYIRWMVWATKRQEKLIEEEKTLKEELKWLERYEYWGRVVRMQPLYKRKQKLKEEIKELEKVGERVKRELEEMKALEEELMNKLKYKQYVEIKEKLESIERYERMEKKVKEKERRREMRPRYERYMIIKTELKTMYEEKESLNKTIGGRENEYKRYQAEREKIEEYEAKLVEIRKLRRMTETVRERIKGYKAWLLREKVGPIIKAYTNAISRQMHGCDDWELTYDVDEEGHIHWRMLDGGGIVYMNKASGYQRFMMMMAMRIALSQISKTMRCKQLIIDEGFTSADTEHLERVPGFLKGLVGIYESVLLVSHLDVIKDSVDKYVEVKRENKVSYLEEEDWQNEINRRSDTKKKRVRRNGTTSDTSSEGSEGVNEVVVKKRGRGGRE